MSRCSATSARSRPRSPRSRRQRPRSSEVMFEQLADVERRFEELTHRMSDPSFGTNIEELKQVSKERAKLEVVVVAYRQLKKLEAEVKGARDLLEESDDEEIREMAK